MKVLILGNGFSRLNKENFINSWKGKIWICNQAYKEFKSFPRIDLLGTVHPWCISEAKDIAKNNNLNFEIITIDTFKKYLGYSTGNELINEAILRGYKDIYLLGFDSLDSPDNFDEDIYMGTIYIGNFLNQLDTLIQRHNLILKKVYKYIYNLKKM